MLSYWRLVVQFQTLSLPFWAIITIRRILMELTLGWRTWIDRKIADPGNLSGRICLNRWAKVSSVVQVLHEVSCQATFSQLPTTLFFFCNWGNKKPNHQAPSHRPYLTLVLMMATMLSVIIILAHFSMEHHGPVSLTSSFAAQPWAWNQFLVAFC